MKYKKPNKVVKTEIVERVVRPARYEERDTGEKAVNRTRNARGVLEDKELPIIERVWRPAEKEEVAVKRSVWEVEQEDGQIHEFANEEDALDFLKGKEEFEA